MKEIIGKKSKEIKELEDANSKLRIKITTLESMLEDSKEEIQRQAQMMKQSSFGGNGN